MAQRQIGVTFTSENMGLYQWAIEQAKKRPMPVAWFVIEALSFYKANIPISPQNSQNTTKNLAKNDCSDGLGEQ